MDELEGLRGKLRRADKHYAVMCRAVEQLEGELKAQGDQHAVDKINSENRCKKLQQQVQGLAAQGQGLGETLGGEWGVGSSGGGGGYSGDGGGGVLGLVDQGAISDQNSLAFQVTTTLTLPCLNPNRHKFYPN